MRILIIVYFLFIFLGGCTSKEIPKIVFDIDEQKSCDISELFTDREIVFLETNKESLLGWISKIIRFDDKIYILDRGANSVVIFDTTGKYISAIRPSGRGPREYMGLSDFAIDRENQRLIIHAHRPGKLLFYDLEGHFKNEMSYKPLVSAMTCDSGRLILVNSLEKGLSYFTFLTFDEQGKVLKKQSSSFTEKINSNQFTMGSLLLNSEKLTFARRFDNTLYTLEGDKVIPRYLLDFQNHNVPERLCAPGEEEEEKRMELQKGGYFFSLVDIKETPSYIFLKTNRSEIMRITKKTVQGEYWKYFTDSELGLQHSWPIGVEESSNRMICFYHPIFLTKLSLENKWERLPQWLADKLKGMDEGNNPLLIFYKSKE